MKLYRTTGAGAPIWTAAKGEAATARKTLISERGAKRADVKTIAVDVPTKKADLVVFLNQFENGVVAEAGGE
jgi:hypothetical protein